MRRSSFLRWRIRVSYFAIVNPCVDFPLTSSLSTFPLATSFRRPHLPRRTPCAKVLHNKKRFRVSSNSSNTGPYINPPAQGSQTSPPTPSSVFLLSIAHADGTHLCAPAVPPTPNPNLPFSSSSSVLPDSPDTADKRLSSRPRGAFVVLGGGGGGEESAARAWDERVGGE